MEMFVSKLTRAEYIFWAIIVKPFILSNNFFTIWAQTNEYKHSWGLEKFKKIICSIECACSLRKKFYLQHHFWCYLMSKKNLPPCEYQTIFKLNETSFFNLSIACGLPPFYFNNYIILGLHYFPFPLVKNIESILPLSCIFCL